MPFIRSLVLAALLLVASGLATTSTDRVGSDVVSLFATTALSAQGPECNFCHQCSGPNSHLWYISELGVSMTEIESEPSEAGDCRETCEDFGGECDVTQTVVAPLADALLEGEVPSVATLGDTQQEQMRYVHDRDIVVFLSACNGSVALAFPAREDEREVLRKLLRPYVTPVAG